ncbi:MAG: hypothetical protein R2713_09155 [Ilumatobacteraceae bacterium]
MEAGTVAHPDRVAAGIRAVGMQAALGQWGWDAEGVPFGGTADSVLGRQAAQLGAMPAGGLVEGWVTLVGHDLMSDDLAVRASELARSRRGHPFHISPHTGDPASYLQRTGQRPLVHLDELGVLGPTRVARPRRAPRRHRTRRRARRRRGHPSCPWAYLRLAQGFPAAPAPRRVRGGQLALGCDAENAGGAGRRAAPARCWWVSSATARRPLRRGAHGALALRPSGAPGRSARRT